MKRNITLIYILSFLRTSWFWLGIWVFWYLRFTDYAGIGLVETVMIFTMTLFEIPTGAIADLFGRKKTLIIAFIAMGMGNIYMGLTPNFIGIFIAVLIGNVGATLYSGTDQALAYDSLKSIDNEKHYDKVISNINTFQLAAMCICGALGGLLFKIDPRLPFVMAGVFDLIGFVICLLLKEPAIDTEKFSFRNYLSQTTQGFKQLFKTTDLVRLIILLVIIGGIMTISDEMVDSILGVEFGFNPIQLGIFTSVVFAVAALVSHYSNKLNLEKHKDLIILGLLISFTYIISPWAGLIMGGISLVIRNSLRVIFLNTSSVLINNCVESKYRATTISTFNMIKNLPYVFSAYFVGILMDLITARKFSLYLGLTLILILFIYYLNSLRLRSYKH